MPNNDANIPSREGVSNMFDAIAPTYDLTNRVMTLRLDTLWRRKLVSLLPPGQALRVLDCATGTGDQVISLFKNSTRVKTVLGIDLAKDMLAIAEKKTQLKPYAKEVRFQLASALDIPCANDYFDAVTISFGIRNVTDVEKALQEFYRVLKPGGRLLMLEGTVPKSKFIKAAHLVYLRYVLPKVGALLSKNKHAYRYLNETIETFPSGDAVCNLMREAGFSNAKAITLMAGAATIYAGDKHVNP